MQINRLPTGAHYLMEGIRLITHPQLRAFILVPLLINLLLFVIVTGVLIQQFDSAIDWLMSWLPGWLDFLAWILAALVALTVLVAYGYSFSVITNLIAAPFYGLLAEKIELHETGVAVESEPLRQMIPRTIGREFTKLWYFIVRGIGIAILMVVMSFVPLLNLLVPVIGILWGAWSMAIQYVDYAADNNRWRFTALREQLGGNLFSTYGFGGLVMLGTMVPVVNIFIMPAAVAGGTLYYIRELSRADTDT
ncbi:sulfate transporter CysZ [Exilibacterium tricleocarpae]|uniref:Sulfate transporter CysZ n=1 Tax=Exilibacterium tricleocarpae TaxID=2591008 RepID=A0A545TSF8_9GAMM|nr:sulfate transporter CysZ [Exilibacterium tricleocarpae]TQV80156.1 sulfate transporter CysZ [Exilibacterium tricleocarpae]